jgi:hypothetical protein
MSEQVTHTAGPWEVGEIGNGQPGYVYCNNSMGSAVAIVFGKPLQFSVFTRAEEEANARLIAAAPDLLEALIMVRDADEDCRRDGLPTIPPMARNKIDQALAKVEGF